MTEYERGYQDGFGVGWDEYEKSLSYARQRIRKETGTLFLEIIKMIHKAIVRG